MAFIAKHLPDKFYQETEHRSSLRDRLFREVISNLLIHREFTNAFPAKLIIEKDRVRTENWNRPHRGGVIDPSDFSPSPKNPVIARFFKEIGRVDELGSGVRNTFKYCGIYTLGTKPEFVEGDIFKTIIPLKAKERTEYIPDMSLDKSQVRLGDKLGDRLGDRLGDNERKILEILQETPKISITEIAEKIGISTTAVENIITKLKKRDLIERVGSPKAGYWKVADSSINRGNGLGDKLGDRLGDNERKILEILQGTPRISIPELAEKIGISTTAVENIITKMKKKDLVERVGSPKAGFWKTKTTNA